MASPSLNILLQSPNPADSHYTIRKIRPYLSQYSAQLLVQTMVLSKLDYCNSVLTGLPACTIKPLQMIQNAAARLIFSQPKRAHVTPLLVSLHWLPIEARIKFKSLTLAYRVLAGSAPSYLSVLIQPYTPARPLRSSQERLLRHANTTTKSQSRLFSFLLPQWWNDIPGPIRSAPSLDTFKKHLKTQQFQLFHPALDA